MNDYLRYFYLSEVALLDQILEFPVIDSGFGAINVSLEKQSYTEVKHTPLKYKLAQALERENLTTELIQRLNLNLKGRSNV